MTLRLMRFAPERLLDLAGGRYSDDISGQLFDFSRLLLLHFAMREWIIVLDRFNQGHLALGVGLSACFLAHLIFPRTHQIVWVALGLATIKLLWYFPFSENHFYLEYICLALITFFRTEHEEEGKTLLDSLRWLAIWVLFYTGVQKYFYGTYSDGAYLVYRVTDGSDPEFLGNFVEVMKLVLPGEEYGSFASIRPPGPYQLTSWIGLVFSNFIYIGEVIGAGLLVSRRLRVLGIVFAVLLLVGIEVAAHEYFFGLMMINLLMLFTTGEYARRIFPWFWLLYAFLLLGKLGLMPLGNIN